MLTILPIWYDAYFHIWRFSLDFDQCALIPPSKIGVEFVGVLRVGFSTTKLIQVFLHYKSRVNDEVHSMMSSMTTVVKHSLATAHW